MTENLLLKLEEKMTSLLSELENLRKELLDVRHENASLKSEKQNTTKKLQDLVAVLDMMSNEPIPVQVASG